MRRDALRRMIGILGITFAFMLALSTPAHAGYTQPGTSGSLLGEAAAFISDFSQWNNIHGGLPMKVLSMVPAADEGNAVLFLFMMWLHDPQGFGGMSSGSGSTSGSSSSGGPGTVPVGTVGAGSAPLSASGSGGSGSSLGLNNGGGNGGSTGGSPGLGGFSPQTGAGPSVDPAPEPASLTLLAVGGFGLLMGWRARSRKPNSN